MDKHTELRTKEILTPKEAADYLNVHVRTIYRLTKNGDIPGRKIGGSWRFKKDTLDEWLFARENISGTFSPLANGSNTPPPFLRKDKGEIG